MIHGLGAAILSLPQRFWATLDSDAIRIYQSTVYTSVFAAGLYMVFVGIPDPIGDALRNNLGSAMVWLIMCIVGPSVALVAVLWYRHDRYVSLLGQISGNIAVSSVLLTYAVAVVSENWGPVIFAPFVVFANGVWAVLLAVRDIRKVVRTELAMRSR